MYVYLLRMKKLIRELFPHLALRKSQISYKIIIYFKPSERDMSYNLFHLLENTEINKSVIKTRKKETTEILTNSS